MPELLKEKLGLIKFNNNYLVNATKLSVLRRKQNKMLNKSLAVIVFSVLILLILVGYIFLKNNSDFRSVRANPISSPPNLSLKEKERILSTLEARHKENLSSSQKTKILNSLTAP